MRWQMHVCNQTESAHCITLTRYQDLTPAQTILDMQGVALSSSKGFCATFKRP